jgi:hypothetical protein
VFALMLDDYEDCAGRTFFRVVGTDPPTEQDFYSYRDLGKPLLDDSQEGQENWIGVSVYEKRRQAVALARYLIRRRRPIGTFVAEIVIPPGMIVHGKRMGGEGHFNLFERPSILLSCYSRMVAMIASEPLNEE